MSANDVAAVVAEAIGGSEREFARMMTSKAHSLGMSRTVYANASGLPDPRQVTTARDQAILGRAVQWHFPRHYGYFATNRFNFRGREIRTHNRLLGQVEGVDGIKTGYIRASGFNLVTSVHRDGRHIVAVVIGGRTSRTRDAFMRKLIREYIDDASPVHTAGPRSNDAGAPDAGDGPPKVLAAAAAADQHDVANPSPASQTTPSPSGDRVIVPANASVGRTAARNSQNADTMAALAWRELRAFPAWFPYVLVAFIGCAGSLLSAFFTVLLVRWRRRLPQTA